MKKNSPGIVFGMIITLTGLCLFSCLPDDQVQLQKSTFGRLPDGREVHIYTFTTPDQSQLRVMEYGASVVSIRVPNREGKIEHVALGYRTPEEYVRLRHFSGSTVGRYGNRIAGGRFELNGQEYQVSVNDGDNSLHGGVKGFDRVLWPGEEIRSEDGPAVRFTYLSPDGEEGYPGNLNVSVTYRFSADKELRIDYEITTDDTTIHNVTNHTYFNLSGNAGSSILEHRLMINAGHYLPVDRELIPTGEIRAVDGTPMDFRKARPVGERIDGDHEQLKYGNGYDHNWVLDRSGEPLTHAAYVYEPVSGRRMDIHTTEPGLQFYSGNFMDGSDVGHSGQPYRFRYAMALETQHFPDSPNHPHFPSATLLPGDVYRSTTIYRFSTR